MRLLGAKIEAKVLAEQSGVPVAPWSGGPVETLDDGLRHAATIGYPLIIKSRSGGGGRGIRIVRSEDELADALERTQVEALRTFGDPIIFMERLVEGGRHIEVQVIADQHGNVWAPGVRDCSVQRRNQKVIEESSSPALSPEQDASLRESAKALVKAAGYVNAGTVEFLYQPDEKLFTFLEVNTRLQVEHPVTEATTGPRHRQAADPRRRRRPARGRRAGGVRPRRRGPAQRRGRRPGVRARPRHGRVHAHADRARASAWTPACPSATPSRRPTTRWSRRSSPGAGTGPRRSPACASRCARRRS